MMKLSVLIIAAVLTQACSSPSEEPSAEQPQQQPASQAEKNPPPVATSTSAVTSVPQPASATGPQPKLLVPVKKIDFGTQRAGKSLMRTITVKNIGKVELKIESVVPS
ncbi:MAG TPA: hypothetical protein VID27_09265 [Blastocatellia bacterium]